MMTTVELVGGPRCGEIHTVPTPYSPDAWLDVTDATRDACSSVTAAPVEDAKYRIRMFAAYGTVRPSINMSGNVRAEFAGWHK